MNTTFPAPHRCSKCQQHTQMSNTNISLNSFEWSFNYPLMNANASEANVTSFLVIPLRLHRARPRYSPRSSANVTCSDGVHLGVLNLQEMWKLSQQMRRRRTRRLCLFHRHCAACHLPPRLDRNVLLCVAPVPLHWCYVWPRSTEAGGAITDELSPSGLSHTTGEDLSSPSPLMALDSTA